MRCHDIQIPPLQDHFCRYLLSLPDIVAFLSFSDLLVCAPACAAAHAKRAASVRQAGRGGRGSGGGTAGLKIRVIAATNTPTLFPFWKPNPVVAPQPPWRVTARTEKTMHHVANWSSVMEPGWFRTELSWAARPGRGEGDWRPFASQECFHDLWCYHIFCLVNYLIPTTNICFACTWKNQRKKLVGAISLLVSLFWFLLNMPRKKKNKVQRSLLGDKKMSSLNSFSFRNEH